MKTKVFIFDLDGVIVDTAKYHFLAWQKIANQLGINFTHEHNEQLKGVSRIQSLELILKIGNISLTQNEKDQLLIEKNENYLSYLVNMDSSELLPNVLEVLTFLKSQKQLIALGSASKNARPILEKTGINSFFDAIVDGNDVSNAKPDPEVFLVAAQKVSKTATEAIVFEDSVAGIEAANIANMLSVGIGEVQVLNKAKYVFKDFSQINQDFFLSLIEQ